MIVTYLESSVRVSSRPSLPHSTGLSFLLGPSLNHELTPMLSNAAPRSGLTSMSSVTPLGDLLATSTATSQPAEEEKTDDHVRDSTTRVNLGDIDGSRFSTVALNIGGSKRPSAASHSDSRDRRSSTASFPAGENTAYAVSSQSRRASGTAKRVQEGSHKRGRHRCRMARDLREWNSTLG
jgi:hypothetical protein